MQTRTKGIRVVANERIVDKQYRGQRVFQRLGPASQEEAEFWLRRKQSEIDTERENQLRKGGERLFADGAHKYLMECQQRKVRTLELISSHVQLLLPYVGRLPLREVCSESFETFKIDRIEEGVKNVTINRSLEVVRTILNRAARVWREDGKSWLSASPLIEMLDETGQVRLPQPLSWAEQAKLMPILALHLQRPVLFALNTGARDENVCGLKWRWEVNVPELSRSVFVIPAEEFKGKRPHVLILNDVALKVVEACRGQHEEYVFVYRRERVKNFNIDPVMPYRRIETLNNTAWQTARSAIGMPRLRVHDLRHAFGQRLRDAGVTEEDRALLLGHAMQGMPQHYATATVARPVEAANSVSMTVDRTTLLRVVNSR